MTPDEFTVQHLLQRISLITARYEKEAAETAVAHALALQERDDEIARLKAEDTDVQEGPTT